jgi:hypothetical protein
MGKFHRIESLIEKEVAKLPLPDDIGEGPEWKNFSENKKNSRRHSFKRKNHKRR